MGRRSAANQARRAPCPAERRSRRCVDRRDCVDHQRRQLLTRWVLAPPAPAASCPTLDHDPTTDPTEDSKMTCQMNVATVMRAGLTEVDWKVVKMARDNGPR